MSDRCPIDLMLFAWHTVSQFMLTCAAAAMVIFLLLLNTTKVALAYKARRAELVNTMKRKIETFLPKSEQDYPQGCLDFPPHHSPFTLHPILHPSPSLKVSEILYLSLRCQKSNKSSKAPVYPHSRCLCVYSCVSVH